MKQIKFSQVISSKFFMIVFVLLYVYSYFSFLGKLPNFRLTFAYEFMLITLSLKYIFLILSGKKKLTYLEMTVFLLLIWISLLQFLWSFEIIKAGGLEDFLENASATFLLTWLMWFMGIDFADNLIEVRHSKLAINLVKILFIIYSISYLYGCLISYETYGTWMFFFKNYSTNLGFDYNGYSDLYAFLSIFLIWLVKNPLQKLLVYFIGSLILFFSFSRTPFYLFILWGGVYVFVSLRRNVKKTNHNTISSMVIVFSFLFFAIITLSFISRNFQVSQYDLINRMFILLKNPFEDQSVQSRIYVLKEGLNQIKRNWLFGCYMAEWWPNHIRGDYIHNWLSFLNAYGIGPFVTFVAISISIFVKTHNIYRRTKEIMFVALIGFSFSAILVSRSYIWPFIWFPIGVISSFKERSYGENRLFNSL